MRIVPTLVAALALLSAIPAQAAYGDPVSFSNSDVLNRSFVGQDLRGAEFTNGDIVGSDFRGANLAGASFSNVDLRNVDFTNAILTGASFSNVDLRNVDFTNAILTGASFSNVGFANVTLRSTDLRNAIITNCDIDGPLHLQGALTQGMHVTNCDLPMAVAPQPYPGSGYAPAPQIPFVVAPPSTVPIPGIPLIPKIPTVPAAPLTDGAPSFINSTITNRSFAGQNLRGAQFVNVNIGHVDFHGADLTDASFTNCKVVGPINFTGAVVAGVRTTNCSLDFAGASAAPQVTIPVPADTVIVHANTIRQAVSKVGATIDIRVQFDYNSARLNADGVNQAEQILTALKAMPEGVFLLTGHTDADGSEPYNLQLSTDRAQAVANYLMSNGIARENLRVLGAGESQPVATNATEDGKARNRRVTITRLR